MGNQVKDYFDIKANTYNEKSQKGIWNFIKKKESQKILNNLVIQSEAVILDLGAGAGYYAIKIRELYNINVMAFEFSESMIDELVKNRIPVTKLNLESDFRFPKYDTALLLGVLEFMSKPEIIIKNLANSSKVGSKVIVLFPEGGIVGFLYKSLHQIWGCPVYFISEKELVEIFIQNGFKLENRDKATFMSNVLRFSFQA